ncbi:MAG: asparaginase [Myxococcota bacterium]
MNVLCLRSGFVETTHPVRVVAMSFANPNAPEVVYASGPMRYSPWRSAAKPIQTWTCLDVMGDPELSPEALAIASASHSAQPDQIALVRGLLERFGVPEDALQCGATAPLHAPTRDAMIRAGEPFTDVHNCCSGKHALMLAACLKRGWSMRDYLSPTHPLQQAITRQVARWSGEAPGLGVDGCGLPTFYVSVMGMARAWGWMGVSADARAQRVAQAIQRHPRLTSGDGRIDLTIHARITEPYAGKIGADGVFCIMLPMRKLSIGLKVLTGDEDALAVAVVAALQRIDPSIFAGTAPWPWATIQNVAGRAVGQRLVAWGDGV